VKLAKLLLAEVRHERIDGRSGELVLLADYGIGPG
jgi:hypothetical protein